MMENSETDKFSEMTDEQLQEIIGVPYRQKKKNPFKPFKRIEPPTPVITEFNEDYYYQKKFYDAYVDKNEQSFNALNCSRCAYRHKGTNSVRLHFMTHFPTDEFEKYRCNRCNKNYGRLPKLKSHASIGQCFITDDFPRHSYFVRKMSEENPQQNSNKCSRCNKEFKSVLEAGRHFLSCARIGVPCIKCNTYFPSYTNARLHHETCTGDPDFKRYRFFFSSDKVTPPSIETIDKVWSEKDMINHMKDNAVPQMIKLFERFPKGALGYIGQTKNIKQRFTQYNCHNEFYESNEATGFLEFDDSILFRCWTRYDGLLYEFLLQHHTINKDGLFFDTFGHRMNQLKIVRPKKSKDLCEKEPIYVYFKASRVPYKKIVEDTKEFSSPPQKKVRPNSPQASTSTAKQSNDEQIPSPTLWNGGQPFDIPDYL